jgi:molecular chaperone DnaK
LAPVECRLTEVTFDIDANGILTVKAKDKATNKENKITIQGSSNLSKEDVERMKKEAQAHAAEDRKRKETVDMRNQADTLISVSEKTLKDAGDKAKPEDKTSVEEKIKALKDVKDKDDIEGLKKAMDALSEAIQKVGAAMYEQGQQAAGQPGTENNNSNPSNGSNPSAGGNPSTGSGPNGGPVDAEYKEVK